ncbi:hypothetical protein M0804_006909 [Polistes exclamans]|nr:hypothetical protein M0804_006909 [Polistes exclamans]
MAAVRCFTAPRRGRKRGNSSGGGTVEACLTSTTLFALNFDGIHKAVMVNRMIHALQIDVVWLLCTKHELRMA